jgi:hypothetical protein
MRTLKINLSITLLLCFGLVANAQTAKNVEVRVNTSGNTVYFTWTPLRYHPAIFRIESDGDDGYRYISDAVDFMSDFGYWYEFGYGMTGNPYVLPYDYTFVSGRHYRLAYKFVNSYFNYRIEGNNPSGNSMTVKFAKASTRYGTEEVFFSQTILMNQTEYSTYWSVTGTDLSNGEIHYTDWVEFDVDGDEDDYIDQYYVQVTM